MPFDFKKEYKEYYLPKVNPLIVTIPKMKYIAVNGKGNPNDENGEYRQSINLLYSIAYTIKMSYKSNFKIDGFIEFVVPPLEGFWWQEDNKNIDYSHKENFSFISIIRMPDFVTKKVFDWAITEVFKKKGLDCSKVNYIEYEEGFCVQCMHIGSYDDEPKTIAQMENYLQKEGYVSDISKERHHHEIYLSNPKKCESSKLKTVIRLPIKKVK